MTAIPPPPPENPAARRWIPLLILGILATFGVMALYFLIPGFQPIDIGMMLVVVGISVIGYDRGTLRGVITIVILYVATGAAATLYQTVGPYVGNIQEILSFNLAATPEESVNRSALALAFSLLTVAVWGVLELIGRFAAPDTRLQAGILDKIGGLFVHLVIGVLVASLLFNGIGYGRSRNIHNRALLRPTFNQVLYLYYKTQTFWFSRNPPPIYVYDLNVR